MLLALEEEEEKKGRGASLASLPFRSPLTLTLRPHSAVVAWMSNGVIGKAVSDPGVPSLCQGLPWLWLECSGQWPCLCGVSTLVGYVSGLLPLLSLVVQ